ncbi:sigma-E factor negative regulatory protein [Pseudohongiella spirulinae]|uniref:Negative regulator of sigma E activity n=1 Tax=Pseudohongiella spirulinae TaxID=1249552 RepID=A0A0S2KD61_9GAMM|nr:sigma-E factor negative regulatory protein [Pseudohongiella spirulinae]ALO46252.1 Negative regulator of sigma E activity [Pseudohongiella spirulinae]
MQQDSQTGQNQIDDEALSALIDGELSDFELRRLLSRLDENPDLLERWERYNLAEAALQPELIRRPMSSSGSQSFARRVMQQVADEQPLQATPSKSQWRIAVGRVAVAASVALAVFVGMQTVLPGDGQPLLAGNTDSQKADSSDSAVFNSESRQVAVQADAQQRLNEYIRSVNIPARAANAPAPFNVLNESPLLRPVSDRELVETPAREPASGQ